MLVTFVDSVASKCHTFWKMFLHAAEMHACTSAGFSTDLSSALVKVQPVLALVNTAGLNQLFQGHPFRIRQGAAGRK